MDSAMASQAFSGRFLNSTYNPNDALDAARFQETVFDFVNLVRDDSLDDPKIGAELMNKFCKLVNDTEV